VGIRSSAHPLHLMRPRRPLCFVLAPAVLGALGATGLPGCGPPQSGSQRLLLRHFAVMRTVTELPAPATSNWLAEAIAPFERTPNIQTTQKVKGRSGSFWILSTEDLLCVAQARGIAAACATQAVAVRKGVFLGTFDPPSKNVPRPHNFIVQGVVPDWVHSIQVVTGGRQTALADVSRNAFSRSSNEPIHVGRLYRSHSVGAAGRRSHNAHGVAPSG
jgi:hypothetical protein